MGGTKPWDIEKLRKMEAEARTLAKLLDKGLQGQFGERMGFTLFLFTFDGSELTYISNAQRPDMILAIKEWLAKQDREGSVSSEKRN